jgi:hypothetical protein
MLLAAVAIIQTEEVIKLEICFLCRISRKPSPHSDVQAQFCTDVSLAMQEPPDSTSSRLTTRRAF